MATASMSMLRIASWLSIDIKIHLIDTGLPLGSQFGVPITHVQLNLAESLHREATPYTLALWRKWLDTVASSAKLITKDVVTAFFPSPHVRTKHSGLSVIDGSYRLPPHCSGAEEFIKLAHRGRIR